jgi:hypothetical protein
MTVVLYATPEAPEVILALDRSPAMSASFGNTTQIGAAQDALMEVVTKYQRQIVSFDYVEFPFADFNCSQNYGCCVSQVAPIDPRSFKNMLHRCDGGGCPASSERPTGQALGACANYYSSQFGSGSAKRYVVLVTDGPPTPDCSVGNGAAGCRETTIVRDLRAISGVPVETAVVVLGNLDDPCLSDIATFGGWGTNPPFYYSAATPDGLATTLNSVIGAMVTDACHLDLGGSPDNPNQVVLLLNGAIIPRGDGWQFDDSSHTHITLSTSACLAFLDNPESLGLLGCTSSHPH